MEKEDKLVAAKNEENAKVSALSKPEEPAPVIDKSAPPQLTLKRSYKKGKTDYSSRLLVLASVPEKTVLKNSFLIYQVFIN